MEFQIANGESVVKQNGVCGCGHSQAKSQDDEHEAQMFHFSGFLTHEVELF